MKRNPQRDFFIGDNWFFYKIYTGYKTSDKILAKSLEPLCKKLVSKGIIDKWFFIRYADPKYHLRLRLHFVDVKNIGFVIQEFSSILKGLMDEELIFKIQTDTYSRELERYGSNTIELSEDLFYYDSKMVSSFINATMHSEDQNEIRWLFSIRAIDSFLDSFQYSLEEKKQITINLSVSFRREFDTTRFLGKQLNDKFRKERLKIEHIMYVNNGHKYNFLVPLLENRKDSIKSTVGKILQLNENEEMEIQIDSFVASHIHMFMNRLFRSKNRTYEMICYDFLCRYYKSQVARIK